MVYRLQASLFPGPFIPPTREERERPGNDSYKHLLYLAPCASLFIECHFWLDPGDFERFFAFSMSACNNISSGWGNVGLFVAFFAPWVWFFLHVFASSDTPSPPRPKKVPGLGGGFLCIWGSLKANPHHGGGAQSFN